MAAGGSFCDDAPVGSFARLLEDETHYKAFIKCVESKGLSADRVRQLYTRLGRDTQERLEQFDGVEGRSIKLKRIKDTFQLVKKRLPASDLTKEKMETGLLLFADVLYRIPPRANIESGNNFAHYAKVSNILRPENVKNALLPLSRRGASGKLNIMPARAASPARAARRSRSRSASRSRGASLAALQPAPASLRYLANEGTPRLAVTHGTPLLSRIPLVAAAPAPAAPGSVAALVAAAPAALPLAVAALPALPATDRTAVLAALGSPGRANKPGRAGKKGVPSGPAPPPANNRRMVQLGVNVGLPPNESPPPVSGPVRPAYVAPEPELPRPRRHSRSPARPVRRENRPQHIPVAPPPPLPYVPPAVVYPAPLGVLPGVRASSRLARKRGMAAAPQWTVGGPGGRNIAIADPGAVIGARGVGNVGRGSVTSGRVSPGTRRARKAGRNTRTVSPIREPQRGAPQPKGRAAKSLLLASLLALAGAGVWAGTRKANMGAIPVAAPPAAAPPAAIGSQLARVPGYNYGTNGALRNWFPATYGPGVKTMHVPRWAPEEPAGAVGEAPPITFKEWLPKNVKGYLKSLPAKTRKAILRDLKFKHRRNVAVVEGEEVRNVGPNLPAWRLGGPAAPANAGEVDLNAAYAAADIPPTPVAGKEVATLPAQARLGGVTETADGTMVYHTFFPVQELTRRRALRGGVDMYLPMDVPITDSTTLGEVFDALENARISQRSARNTGSFMNARRWINNKTRKNTGVLKISGKEVRVTAASRGTRFLDYAGR